MTLEYAECLHGMRVVEWPSFTRGCPSCFIISRWSWMTSPSILIFNTITFPYHIHTTRIWITGTSSWSNICININTRCDLLINLPWSINFLEGAFNMIISIIIRIPSLCCAHTFMRTRHDQTLLLCCHNGNKPLFIMKTIWDLYQRYIWMRFNLIQPGSHYMILLIHKLLV